MNTFMFWTLQSKNTREWKHYYLSNTSTLESTLEENKAVAFHHKKNAEKFLEKHPELKEKYCIVIMEYETETNETPNYFDKQ